jgi:hypothetical protein
VAARQPKDIRIRKPGIPWMLIIVILVIGVIGGLVGAWTGTRQAGYLLCIGLPIPLFVMASARIGDRAMRRRLQAAAEKGGQDPTPAMAEAVSRRVFWPSRSAPLSEMAKQLVAKGRLGETVRMQWKGGFAPVQPLTVVFEPRLLDESDGAFSELEAATTPDVATGVNAAAPAPAVGDDAIGVRHIRRNLKLKGGWAFVIMFAAFMFRSAVESYQRGAMTWELPFWTTMLLLFLVGPARGGPFGRAQWLLAPGAVLVRKAVRRTTRSQLHVFDRRRSVLCVSQHRKSQWLIVAADAVACEQTLATDREVHFLLRAWLSPLEPPQADRLTDLT